jgi:preprotein translocase subunit SecE
MTVEKVKSGLAALIAISGIVAYYWLTGQPNYVRVGAMFGCFVVAIVVFALSESGKEFFAYAKESIDEAKRVVWPTRKEAMQATLMVFVFVFIMALFLWGVDAILLWLTQKFLGAR